MTQEEKKLLLRDLCARLPYGVKANIPLVDGDKRIYTVSFNDMKDFVEGYINIKPYLRSMYSMNEEEENEYHNLCKHELEVIPDIEDRYIYTYYDTVESIDWLNKYRGLIPMGLALKATEGMYKS